MGTGVVVAGAISAGAFAATTPSLPALPPGGVPSLPALPPGGVPSLPVGGLLSGGVPNLPVGSLTGALSGLGSIIP